MVQGDQFWQVFLAGPILGGDRFWYGMLIEEPLAGYASYSVVNNCCWGQSTMELCYYIYDSEHLFHQQ